MFWLRGETKENEFRRALDPIACKSLLDAGHRVAVEDWTDSIIPTKAYEDVGCEIVKNGSWVESSKETIVIGLKALPKNNDVFHHRHIFFAHVYKEQDGWKDLMNSFTRDGGRIIDLEFMVDEHGRRVCAFGYWAGYVGACLGALINSTKDLDSTIKELSEKKYFSNQAELINFIQERQKETSNNKEAIVIGSQGRSGNGAIDALKDLDWSVTGWDKIDTASGGPFKEILNFDLFVNCVLAMGKMPPFINKDLIETNEGKLGVISDVSCDPDSDCNMVPLYSEATTIEAPFHLVKSKTGEIKITAIDNLPSILPKESSEDFSSQLVEHLIDYSEGTGPVYNALNFFSKTQLKLA